MNQEKFKTRYSLFFFSFFCFLFVYFFLVCFVLFFKLKIFVLIHIWFCGRVSDKKFSTRPICGNMTTFFFCPSINWLNSISGEAKLPKKLYLKSDSHLPKKIRSICFIESPLKLMKNTFYFILKALFVLKIFKFS